MSANPAILAVDVAADAARSASVRPATSENAAPDEAAPLWLERGRIPCLDGLRAFSIAMVFVEHAIHVSGTLPAGPLGRLLGNMGGIGVDIFFAISGFLITLLLLRESRRTHTISLKEFYIRRFLRLMPAAVVFLLVVFVLDRLGRVPMSAGNWVHVLTYTVNFDANPTWETGHLWSLSIEEQFYFLWPLTLLVLGAGRARAGVIGWLLAAPVVRLALLRVFPHDFGRYENWTPLRVDSIAAGCLLALVAHHPKFLRLALPRHPAALALIGAAALGLVVNFLVGTRIDMYGVAVENSFRAALIAVIIWLSINQASSLWGRLLDSRPMVTIGILSYSLYLWQQLFLVPHATERVRTLPWAIFAAIACAVASYVLVERPFLRLKDRFGR